MRRTAVLVIAVGAAMVAGKYEHTNGEFKPQDVPAGICAASMRLPDSPRPLEFCEWHSKRSCCTPSHDVKSREYFMDIAGGEALGLGCASAGHYVKHTYLRLRHYACLACDPVEPLARFNAYEGYPKNNIQAEEKPATDTLVAVLDGQEYEVKKVSDNEWTGTDYTVTWNATRGRWMAAHVGNGSTHALSADVYPTRPDVEGVEWEVPGRLNDTFNVQRSVPEVRFMWRICQSFVDKAWNGSGAVYQQFGKIYDKCGVVWDDNDFNGPYAIMPSARFQGLTGGQDFLAFIGQEMPNFRGLEFDFTVVDDVQATEEVCRNCTINNNQCEDCPNGCTYSAQEGVCKAFNWYDTPCFTGEDRPLPDRPESDAANAVRAPLTLLVAGIVALLFHQA